MTTSQTSFLSEILSGEPIPAGKVAYFRARLSNKLHELILMEFERLSKLGKISRAELARRTGRKPEQVTRWLGAPGNWTIETFSDLALGMGCEPAFSLVALGGEKISQKAPSKIPANVVMPRNPVNLTSWEHVAKEGAALAAARPPAPYEPVAAMFSTFSAQAEQRQKQPELQS